MAPASGATMRQRGYVYFMTNRMHGTLYCGVTSNLMQRVDQRRQGIGSSFTRRYKLNRLVYFEEHSLIADAIQKESNIRHWPRAWKVRLIEEFNPDWKDLSEGMWVDK